MTDETSPPPALTIEQAWRHAITHAAAAERALAAVPDAGPPVLPGHQPARNWAAAHPGTDLAQAHAAVGMLYATLAATATTGQAVPTTMLQHLWDRLAGAPDRSAADA